MQQFGLFTRSRLHKNRYPFRHHWQWREKFCARTIFSAILCAAIICAGNSYAATINVNQTNDFLNGDTSSIANLIASDGGDGISLREAIIAANNTAGADTINVGAGTHNLAIAGDGEDLAATGDLDIFGDLTISGAGAGSTTIDGNLLDRVFDITALVTVSISDLTVTEGDINQPGGGIQNVGDLALTNVDLTANSGQDGGGVATLAGGSLSITGGQISNNTADDGGGVWVKDPSAATVISGVTMSGNIVPNHGGAIYNEGNALSISSSTLTNNNAKRGGGVFSEKDNGLSIIGGQISINTATEHGGGIWIKDPVSGTTLTNLILNSNDADKKGGGIYVEKGISLDITGGQINNNTTNGEDGGGVFINETVSGATFSGMTLNGNLSLRSGGAIYVTKSEITISNSTIDNNDARDGGGIYSHQDEGFSITSSQISNNDATEDGGGIWINDSNIGGTLTDVTISGNTAVDLGGGMFNDSSTLSITAATFSGNDADEGGGIYNKAGSDTLSLVNSTLSGNSASTSGGGIFAKDGDLNLTNVTIASNSSGSGSGLDADGGTTSLLNTLIAGNTGSPDVLNNNISSLGTNLIGNASASSGWIGSDILNISPTIAALANNGGSTQTHAYLAGSRGINEGTNAGAPGIDQRGVVRDATVDIGAYEFLAAPSLTIDKDVDIANISGLTTLTYTITIDNDGNVGLTSPSLNDQLTQDGASQALTTGPTLSGDTNSNGIIDVDETWVYTATYDVTQANLDDGNDLINTAEIDTAETTVQSDTATTTITTNVSMTISKTADITSDASVGQTINYTYVVVNNGNQTISDVVVSDAHVGSGSPPNPTIDSLSNDVAPLGDSTDAGTDDIWDLLAPGDEVTFTSTYVVTQNDVDTLQ